MTYPKITSVHRTWYEWLASWLERRGSRKIFGKIKYGGRRMIRRKVAVEQVCKAATWDPRNQPSQAKQHFTPPFKEIDYLERFYVLSAPWIGIYLHRFWSDDDDGLHDHPWSSASVLLHGGYLEEMPERQGVPYGPTIQKLRRPRHPWIKFRTATDAHRITIPVGYHGTWSLFIRFSFKRRIWGFYRNGGWKAAEVQSRDDIK